jgi:3-hydroxyisobutyrate dehydrogenase
MDSIGFVGLGNMGGVLAGNLVACGQKVVVHDAAGPGRNVDGATFVTSAAAIAEQCDVVVFSLPDGAVSESVARELIAADPRLVTHVVDTSTVGPTAARAIAQLLADAGITYVDSPVSGGVSGARARTLAVMYSASDAACAHVAPVLAGLSDKTQRVGDRAGLAQAVKLANNVLSATALAATSEAVAFAVDAGVDMAVLLDVLNASSGRNTATSDKFPNQVMTGRYAAGFSNSLMAKDVALFLGEARAQGGPITMAEITEAIWKRFADAEPGADFTRVYPFVAS